MPIQALCWTDFLSCSVCFKKFTLNLRPPISLGCGHTICRICLNTLNNKQCPFDQISSRTIFENLPTNYALLHLVNEDKVSYSGKVIAQSETETERLQNIQSLLSEDLECYKLAKQCMENLALYLKSFINNGSFGSLLSRPMQRKLICLFNCQLMEDEGKLRALRIARALGERSVIEFLLQNQNSQKLSSNLWAAMRLRGCQFLGPATQEEVLKLILLALEDGSALARKVLVLFIFQQIEFRFPLVTKTSIGHVVQLIYRANCFTILKREADSSLMQLKEDFRIYETLRREHDAQIVKIASESGVRIAPEQWSLLLYGDNAHKSHMQSVIDKLQAMKSFSQSIQELTIALQRTGEVDSVQSMRVYLKHLSCIDLTMEHSSPSWPNIAKALDAVKQVVIGLVQFKQHQIMRKLPTHLIMNPNTQLRKEL